MSTASATVNPYDEIPYPSQPLPQTHPDRLATVAKLFGMQPRGIDRCRVLELGCGNGANLIPMADRHPASEFIGIDYSQRQIDTGREAITALDLGNIELECSSIMDLDERLGRFDYIICHGVFSWVVGEVQEKILALCKSLLASQGVAYVSYNTYPGWHFRGVLRELVCGASPAQLPTAARLAQARAALGFVKVTLADETSPYSQLLRTDIDFVLSHSDSYLFHEYLEAENHPLYFHEFAARAAAHRLQYLGDTMAVTMFPASFGQSIEQKLRGVARDAISLEQHMDMLRNRCFRQTLLCHDTTSIVRSLSLENLEGLHFASLLRPESSSCDLHSTTPERFMTVNQSVITTHFPLVKAALLHLGAEWPRAFSLDALIAGAAARLGSAAHPAVLTFEDRQGLRDNIGQLLVAGLIEPYWEADSFVTSISACPRASNLARSQARSTTNVTNRRHQWIVLDELSQYTLRHLDGQRDREELLKVLMEAVNRGQLSVLRDGVPVARGEGVANVLDVALDKSLERLAANALLVA